MKILVLDDNVDVAEGVGEILELSGHDVVLVHDGLSAVAAYRNGDIDFGFFDIRMPGMNGVEAYLEIRRTHPGAKIVMMSGYADDTLVKTALDNGALGLLSKPFDPEVMLAHVSSIRPSTPAFA